MTIIELRIAKLSFAITWSDVSKKPVVRRASKRSTTSVVPVGVLTDSGEQGIELELFNRLPETNTETLFRSVRAEVVSGGDMRPANFDADDEAVQRAS